MVHSYVYVCICVATYIAMYVHLLSLCMYVCVLDVYVWYVHICIEQENCVGLWRVVFCLCTHTACVCRCMCVCMFVLVCVPMCTVSCYALR